MHPLFFHCVFLPEISGRFLSDPGQKLPVCCSLPLDFGGRSSLTSSHSENTDSHRLHDLPKKLSGISLSCQTLRRSPSCPLAAEAPHAISVTFISANCRIIPVSFLHQKRAHPLAKIHGDTLLYHNPSVGITQIRYGRRSIFLSACHTSSRWLFSVLFFNIAHPYPVVKPLLSDEKIQAFVIINLILRSRRSDAAPQL